MADLVIARESVWEDTGCSLMSRIKGDDAANLVQADLDSISIKFFDANKTSDDVITTKTPDVSDVIFDALQTDARWTDVSDDTEGYNFRYDVDDDVFATGGLVYRVEVWLTPTGGGADIMVPFEIECVNVRKS